MSRKKNDLKEKVSQILYACAGDVEQYDETLNALIGSLEIYLRELGKAAYLCSDSSKITTQSFIEAFNNDPNRKSLMLKINERNSAGKNVQNSSSSNII